MRLSKFLGSVAVFGATFIGVASTAFADTTVAHCIGTNGNTEIEITISSRGGDSRYLSMIVREANLASGREKIVHTVAEETNASYFPRIETYIQAHKVIPYLGFGLIVRNETGYGSLNLLNAPLGFPFGKQYRNLPVTCDIF